MAAKYVVLALAAMCIVQASAGTARVFRRSTDGQTTVQEMVQHATEQLQQLSSDVAEWMNAPSLDEMKTLMENKTKDLEERASNVVQELKRQFTEHGTEFSQSARTAMEQATQHINETIERLKESTPELMNQASDFQQKFNDSFKSAVETLMRESQNMANAAGEDVGSAHEQLATMSRSAMSQTMQVLEQFHNEVQAAVTRATSS